MIRIDNINNKLETQITNFSSDTKQNGLHRMDQTAKEIPYDIYSLQ